MDYNVTLELKNSTAMSRRIELRYGEDEVREIVSNQSPFLASEKLLQSSLDPEEKKNRNGLEISSDNEP